MFFISTWRIIKFAAQNFWRNIWLSAVTVTIIILTLVSLTMLFTVNGLVTVAVESIKDRVDIAIYFKAEVTDDQALQVGQEIANFPEVKVVDYITAQEAMEDFRERHKNDPLIIETLDEIEANPLGPALTIKANDTSQFPEILRGIDGLEVNSLIEEQDFSDHQVIVSRLNQINTRVKQVGIVISVVFALIALLVVFNTIRMGIYAQREEIGIMRLVGAGNFFIKAPFLLESLFYSLLGTLIFAALIVGMNSLWGEAINSLFQDIDFNFGKFIYRNFWQMFGLEFLIILVLNVISTSFAMRKYLKI